MKLLHSLAPGLGGGAGGATGQHTQLWRRVCCGSGHQIACLHGRLLTEASSQPWIFNLIIAGLWLGLKQFYNTLSSRYNFMKNIWHLSLSWGHPTKVLGRHRHVIHLRLSSGIHYFLLSSRVHCLADHSHCGTHVQGQDFPAWAVRALTTCVRHTWLVLRSGHKREKIKINRKGKKMKRKEK